MHAQHSQQLRHACELQPSVALVMMLLASLQRLHLRRRVVSSCHLRQHQPQRGCVQRHEGCSEAGGEREHRCVDRREQRVREARGASGRANRRRDGRERV
eukprot:4057152-Pleurochrysis_carterae.AAC.1